MRGVRGNEQRRVGGPNDQPSCGISADDLAGVPAHDAADAEPLLRAVFQESESVGVVPVPAELLRAVDVRAVDALERGGEDTGNVLHVRDEGTAPSPG